MAKFLFQDYGHGDRIIIDATNLTQAKNKFVKYTMEQQDATYRQYAPSKLHTYTEKDARRYMNEEVEIYELGKDIKEL